MKEEITGEVGKKEIVIQMSVFHLMLMQYFY